MRFIALLVGALVVGMFACGSPSLNCGADANGCSCSVVKAGTSLTCDSTAAGGSVCCAAPGYPDTSGTDCLCDVIPTQVACTSTASTCTCSVGGDGGAASCSLGMGVCCVNGGTCNCFPTSTTCGATELSFTQCDAMAFAKVMAGSSYCNVTHGTGYTHVTACSPFQP